MKKLKIVFMGTPDFAVASLNAIVQSNHSVVGVITAPDKPAGRGQKIQQSGVKKYAIEHNLHILQPTNLKNEDFISNLKKLNADVFVVVAFRMLPMVVWKIPSLGTFNLHASLLPDYRGAAPINWAIINGENKTGVTTFFIDEKIDTGNIILQKETSIAPNETVGELHDKLMEIGSTLVVNTLDLISENEITTIPQTNTSNKKAPKLFKETCKINWDEPLEKIYNLIRGLNPYPAAWTILKNNSTETTAKLFDVSPEYCEHNKPIGTVLSTKNSMKIAVINGYLHIASIQLAGKKKLPIESLLNGYTFDENSKVF